MDPKAELDRVAAWVRALADGRLAHDGDDVALSPAARAIHADLERLAAAAAAGSDARFLEQIVEHLPDMIFVKDAEALRFVRFNAAGEALLGYARTTLLGRNDFDFFPEEQARAFVAKDREVLAGGRVVDIPEEPIQTPVGTRWLHTKKVPLTDEHGVARFLLGISEDITDRREVAARMAAVNAEIARTAEELRARESQLHVLLARFPGAMWTTDAELRVTSVAGSRVDALHLAGSEGRPVSGLFPGTPPEQVLAAHREALGGETPVWEFAHDRRVYEVRLQPTDPADGRGVQGVALDITEHRQAEAERLRERLDRAQRLEMLGLLAGGIAHDFNNLLAAVLGNSSLALMKMAPDHPARRLVERVATTAETAADLTRQLLAYSGKGKFVIEPVDLSKLVHDIGSLLRVTISKKIALRLDLAEDLPHTEVDVAQMRQLVMNLLTNASDAIGDQSGVITVRTTSLDVDRLYLSHCYVDHDVQPGRFVTVEVRDTGVGMDEATRARIFDPFFTTKPRGHGLGLAATLGIVRGHHGAIKVESAAGMGTTMTVLLPALLTDETARNSGFPTAERPTGKGRVLVVDDDDAVRAFAAEVLRDVGFYVLTASDGVDALARFDAMDGNVDLVLLDMTMPRMNGEETYRELRRRKPGVRVLLTSGYSEQEATGRFLGQGLSGFLQKPSRVGDLVARIEELVRR